MHGGTVGHAEAGRGNEVHVIGHRQHVGAGGGYFLGKTAVAGQPHDPVARLQMGNLAAHAGDHTGSLTARRKGERWLDLVLALDDQGIGEIDAGGVDIDDNLVVLGDRIGGFVQRQRAGRSVGFAQYGFHGGSLIGIFPQSSCAYCGGVNHHTGD